MFDFLKSEGISEELLQEVRAFRNSYAGEERDSRRRTSPRYYYYGKAIWEQAITAVLAGENILLSGPKATGKNVLAENLAVLFDRPQYDVSFHVNTDAAGLLGADTYGNGRVYLRKGPVYRCAESGGFGILDEVNMARNESLAVLHAVLDYRRVIDMPGYDRIELHPAARFIGTMNYGYAGTRELNEALTSRFVVIDMPRLAPEGIVKLLTYEFPTLRAAYADQLARLFEEIQTKCESGELSTKTLDLRGLLEAARLMKYGLNCTGALELGLVNKSFDEYEKQLVRDVIASRFPPQLRAAELFD